MPKASPKCIMIKSLFCMKIVFAILSFILTSILSFAQNPSNNILTLEACTNLVKKNHPYALQADIFVDRAKAELQRASGLFDPFAFTSIDQKYFQEKNYFSNLNSGIGVQTTTGIGVNTGFNRSGGMFLNPEKNYPLQGLWTAGVSVPLGQGLFIDDNRAAFKQAKIFNNNSSSQRQKLLNDLLFNAIKQYWSWSLSYNQYQVNQELYNLAKQRFEGIRESFLSGDRSALDTLESAIQMQTRKLQMEETRINAQKEANDLSAFLWADSGEPIRLNENNAPESLESKHIQAHIKRDSSIILQHPELLLIGARIADMQVQKKLAADKLKPRLNVLYNLQTPNENQFVSSFNINNYRWGLDFSMPLFLRRERGRLKSTQFQVQEIKLLEAQRKTEISNNLNFYDGLIANLNGQVAIARQIVAGSKILLDAEKTQFDAGESSVFLINSRENTLATNQIKLLEIQAKLQVANAGSHYVAGRLAE